jgi:hypothetical protein
MALGHLHFIIPSRTGENWGGRGADQILVLKAKFGKFFVKQFVKWPCFVQLRDLMCSYMNVSQKPTLTNHVVASPAGGAMAKK